VSAVRALKPGSPVRMLPSMITILAMCAGLSAVNFAFGGRLSAAVAMIALAAVLDSVDGRVARMLDATSKMGAELDSLADSISFGVAPALVLYLTLLDGKPLGWTLALLFAVSIVVRLARFNTLLEADLPEYSHEYFVGVPAPAGALLALAPLAAVVQWGPGWWSQYAVVSVWMLFCAALIVSRIPTFALKTVSVPPRLAAGLLLLVALAAAALVTYPFVFMLMMSAVYLAHIPFAIYSQRWVAARPETWNIKPAERRAIRRVSHERKGTARLRLRRPAARSSASRKRTKGRK
jgi:CDP-diacylglycerol--serine O-phosphatidyltransferase